MSESRFEKPVLLIDAPFGGDRQTGVGREMGVPGFEEHLELKSIAEGV